MSKKKNSKLYHYVDSGLDYVYLENGFNVIKDPEFGTAISINDLDGLNKAIAKTVVDKIHFIRGQEIRFMRSILKLNQTEMGILLGRDLRTIQRWEEKRNDAVDPTADKFLRLFYTAYADGKTVAVKVCELLKTAQLREPTGKAKKPTNAFVSRVELKDTREGWKTAA
jgi:DNA-binding transcriptional regulator YiaG